MLISNETYIKYNQELESSQDWDDSYEDVNFNYIDDDFEVLFSTEFPGYTINTNPNYIFGQVDNSVLQELYDSMNNLGDFPDYFEDRTVDNPIKIILYQVLPDDPNLSHMSGLFKNLYIENSVLHSGRALQDRDEMYLNVNVIATAENYLPLTLRHELTHLNGQISNRTYVSSDIVLNGEPIGVATDDFVNIQIDNQQYFGKSILEMHAELVAATLPDGNVDVSRLSPYTINFMKEFNAEINRFDPLTPNELRDVLNKSYSSNTASPGNIPSDFMNNLALEMPWYLSYFTDTTSLLGDFVFDEFKSHRDWIILQ